MPGGLDETASFDWQVWAARQTVRLHETVAATHMLNPERVIGRCNRCPAAGPCGAYWSALTLLAEVDRRG